VTIANLPDEYERTLNVALNEWDIDITVRNVIILLIALTVKNTEMAADCMLHVWYSAQLRKSHFGILQKAVRPIIDETCSKLNGQSDTALLGTTWNFGTRSLRVSLTKHDWYLVRDRLRVPAGLTSQMARENRARVTLAETRADHRERQQFKLPATSHMGMIKFLEDGVLVPFGHSRAELCVPNPSVLSSVQDSLS
jgi:hypothetical protein